MTAEQIIRNTLDGYFRRVLPDGTYTTDVKPRDWFPDFKPIPAQTIVKQAVVVKRFGKAWTDAEDQQFINLRNSGKSLEQISRILKRSSKSLRMRWKQYVEDGRAEPVVCLNFAPWRSWPQQTLDIINRMRRDKVMLRDIAEHLNLEYRVLKNYCDANNHMRKAA